jgi:hypothetical protein
MYSGDMVQESRKFREPVPEALSGRPRDKRGYPVPHGVWQDPETGEWDFRVIDQQKRMAALDQKLCAVSGLPMEEGEYWFIGGPGSFVNRLFVDGPMRHEVARFSLMTCPHLLLPDARYRRAGLQERSRPSKTTTEKQEIYMLGMARSYSVETHDDFPYVRAGPWKAVSWWRDGINLKKPVAREKLAALGIRV